MAESILGCPAKCKESRKDEHRLRINVWRDLFFGMFEVEACYAADTDGSAAVFISKCKMMPGPVGADVVEAFMVHLGGSYIERTEFEIVKRYRLFRRLQ